jgi:tetratricopeptide (TPR) repeat protein
VTAGGARASWLLLVLALPPLVFLLLYLPTLDYEFVWTDQTAIGAGTLLRPAGQTLEAFREPLHRIEHRGSKIRQPYYRPLPVVILSGVDQRLGRAPRNFRSVTVAIGALSVAAFGFFAWRVLGRVGAAFFASLFVALHPVAIESVVWIAGVPAALCALFVIAALGLALESVAWSNRVGAVALGVGSLAALVAALLTKERAVVEPALLIAGVAGMGARRRVGRAGVLLLAHVLLVAAYLFGVRPAVLGSSITTLPPVGGSAVSQALTGIAGWPGNLAWLFAPLHSSTSDVVRVVTSFADPWAWLGLLLAAASLLAWALLLRAGRAGSALGLAWIWIAYLPTAGLLPMLHLAGERYLYLSAFGAALLVADAGCWFVGRIGPRWRRVLAPALALLLLAGLAQRTRARLPDWESTRTLFSRDVARDPAFREAYYLLAADHFFHGRYAQAEARLYLLLDPGPEFTGTSSYLNSLSVAELACQNKLGLRRYGEILALERKIALENAAVARVPSFRICLGQAHDGLRRTEEALDIYLSVAQQLGDGAPPRLFLMIARDEAQLGRRGRALEWLAKAQRFGAGDAALQQEMRSLSAYLRRSP